MMAEEFSTNGIITQFDNFINTIDKEIPNLFDVSDNRLTEHLSNIHYNLLENYKVKSGTSNGYHGISEYIVLSAFKHFIEAQNEGKELKCTEIDGHKYSRCFRLDKKDKSIIIYHDLSLKNIPDGAKSQIFTDATKLRVPDIVILKKENNYYNIVAVIEIKNYLDKGKIISAIEMLNQIKVSQKNKTIQEMAPTRYALFAFSGISLNDDTCEEVKKFLNDKNNFLMVNKDKINTEKRKYKEIEPLVKDLSQFFKHIESEIKL